MKNVNEGFCMKYEIKGAPFPVVICDVEAGESLVT